jgi:hypothetical protein
VARNDGRSFVGPVADFRKVSAPPLLHQTLPAGPVLCQEDPLLSRALARRHDASRPLAAMSSVTEDRE